MASQYKPIEAIQLLRPTFRTTRIPRSSLRITRAALSTTSPACATHNTTSSSSSTPPPQPTRRSVTVTNDTGAVRWSDLSLGEKAARTTQQSVNLIVILAGIVATGAVATLLFTDIFSPNSAVSHFNRAVTRIRASPRITALLGPGPDISAYGESSWSRWARNRHISSSSETDKWGTEHLRLRFYLEGPLGQGVAHVHLTKRPSQDEYEYALLAVDVKGKERVVLESAEEKRGGKVGPKMFGVRWR